MEGAVVEGVIEARDERAAIDRLRDSGLIRLQVTVPREKTLLGRITFRSTRAALLTFTMELNALLGAGLPLDRSLNILAEISESKEVEGVVRSVLRAVREGSTFSEALQSQPNVFPNFYVNMIRAGGGQ
jgi:general secretion pathway protein F